MQPLIKLKKHPPSGTIILNRPEKRNSLNRAMLAELQQAFEDFHLERQVRAVILTGAGSAALCRRGPGGNAGNEPRQDAQTQWYHDTVQYKELLELMLRFPNRSSPPSTGRPSRTGRGWCSPATSSWGPPKRPLVFRSPAVAWWRDY